MQLGLHIVNFTPPEGSATLAEMLSDIATTAEQAGLSHLTVMDHFFQLDFLGGAELDMLEAYTTLGFIAAKTRKIRLGVLVTGVTYRHPGLLAKIVTTLDVLSNGRADCGLGAAWYEREHTGLGVPYPALGERFDRLEETIRICLQMWSDDDGPFRGDHYALDETRNIPQAPQRPHPPILIGGGGEQRTLKLVARYAQACNLFTSAGVDGVRAKLEVLRTHCRAENRDYDSIEKTILYTAPLPAIDEHDAFVEEMQAYRALGIARVMVMPGAVDPVREVSELEPLAVALRKS